MTQWSGRWWRAAASAAAGRGNCEISQAPSQRRPKRPPHTGVVATIPHTGVVATIPHTLVVATISHTVVVAIVSFCALLLSACATMNKPAADFDLKIINGRIIDGTGAPWYRGDVGVRGDTITAIGDLSHRSASTTIDAHDQIVSPGFIDLLGQSQMSVLIDPHLEGKVRQGVTTEVTGEGTSPGPIGDREIAARLAADPNDKPRWRTLGVYFDVLLKNGTAINFALFVGASNPREIVIGDVNREATPAELREMERIVDQAMREGAIGISTSLIYLPAMFSRTDELVALAKVAAKYEGVYFSHIRDEGNDIETALDEAFRIGREASIPVNIWHLKVSGRPNWGRMPEVIARIQAARDSGLDVAANVYPYIASSTGLSTLAPNWALEGGYSAFLERLSDPAQRAQIEQAFQQQIDRRGPHAIYVARVPNRDDAPLEKKFLEDIAAQMGVDPIQALVRLFQDDKTPPAAIFFGMSEDDVKAALRTPWVSFGSDSGAVTPAARASQSGAHPRAYGTFPRILGHYVRDEKLFSLEEAVRRMTSQAANRAHLQDRGVLRPGMRADLVVFDAATVADRATFEDPHQFAAGISDVIVNGVAVLRDGQMTQALPGRVLRGKQSAVGSRQ
jgi:N-acyl-D-amino-acid deacylase